MIEINCLVSVYEWIICRKQDLKRFSIKKTSSLHVLMNPESVFSIFRPHKLFGQSVAGVLGHSTIMDFLHRSRVCDPCQSLTCEDSDLVIAFLFACIQFFFFNFSEAKSRQSDVSRSKNKVSVHKFIFSPSLTLSSTKLNLFFCLITFSLRFNYCLN